LISEDVHPPNYIYIHQFDIFNSQDQCSTCHDMKKSCDECHNRMWSRIVDHRRMLNKSTSCKSCHQGKGQ
jgi:hypothetical protein